MKRTILIILGLVAVFVAIAMILPALAKVRDHGSMPGDVVGFYTAGVVLAVGGVGTTIGGLLRRNHAA